MSKKKRKKSPPQPRRKGNQRNTHKPEHWETYISDPITLMQDGEYHLLHEWQLREDDALYGEDPVTMKRRQAAFWDHARNDLYIVRYPDDYKVEDEAPDNFDGDDQWHLTYRADYVTETWGPADEYLGCYDDWDDCVLF